MEDLAHVVMTSSSSALARCRVPVRCRVENQGTVLVDATTELLTQLRRSLRGGIRSYVNEASHIFPFILSIRT